MKILRAPRTRVRPEHLVLAVAAVPVVIMAVEVLAAPRLHFLDYWSVFARVTHDDGSLYPRGIFTLQNEHPMFLPGLLFWLEAKVFGGYNQLLGLLGIAVVAATVALLRRLLPKSLGDLRRAVVTALFSFLLFSPSGLHNFAFGFSGVGWLSANLAAVGAVVLAARGSLLGAAALAVAGCLSYGTAFAVWPALALFAWLRGRALGWVVAPLVIGAAVVATWAVAYDGPGGRGVDRPLGVDSYLATIMSTVGQLWSADVQVASLAGVVTAVGLVAFGARVVRRRIDGEVDTPEAAWLAVGAYAVGAIVMIAVARTGSAASAGDTGRYASLPALATCALVVLAVMRWQRVATTRLVVVSAAVALSVVTLGAAAAHNVRGQYLRQELLTVAMRARATTAVATLRAKPEAMIATEALGAYPFTDDFQLPCGRAEHGLGEKIDVAGLPALTAAPDSDGNAAHADTPVVGDAVLQGWALIGQRQAECVLVTDRAGTVVGGGVVGLGREDLPTVLDTGELLGGWKAVASPGLAGGTVLVGGGDRLYRIG